MPERHLKLQTQVCVVLKLGFQSVLKQVIRLRTKPSFTTAWKANYKPSCRPCIPYECDAKEGERTMANMYVVNPEEQKAKRMAASKGKRPLAFR